MIGANVKLIKETISQNRLYKVVKEISSYHRIQASTGFRKAANRASEILSERGIENRILEFEAQKDVWYLQQKMFKEWDCRGAELYLEDGTKLCDFSEENCSIIQKSYPLDIREGAEVIELTSYDDEYLKSLDLKGKIAFIHDMPMPYVKTAVKKYGIIGLISDYMREVDVVRSRNDAYDTYNYTAFRWKHLDGEPEIGGFVLSPRNGDKLKALCDLKKKAHEKDSNISPYPIVKGYIDSSLYNGKLEVVEALLRGESDEEILITAHLCHPNTSANDNASGVSGSIEVLNVLNELIKAKKLKPLKRSIRLILVPEFTGTHCYLSTMKDYSHIKAGINLDMIGGRQDGTYGPICITRTPYESNSLVNALSDLVLEEVKKQVPNFDGSNYSSLVNSRIAPHSGGSDHIILCDKTIDAPSVMVGQWPDKYYHTSSDTLERIDPLVLAFSTTFAATYVYTLANLDEDDMSLINDRLEVMMMDDLAKVLSNAKINKEKASDTYLKLKTIIGSYKATAKDALRFNLDEVRANEESEYLNKLGNDVLERFVSKNEDAKDVEAYNTALDKKYQRTFIAPIRELENYIALDSKYEGYIDEFNEKIKDLNFIAAHAIESHIPYYLDGKHTLKEASDGIFVQYGMKDDEIVLAFVDLLVKMNMAYEC